MIPKKTLHVRVPTDLYQHLTRYATGQFTPVSCIVLRAIAKETGYNPPKPEDIDPLASFIDDTE